MSRPNTPLLEKVQRELINRNLHVTDSPQALAGVIRQVAGTALPDTQVYALMRELTMSTSLLGPVASLVAEPTVTDVVINGHEQVWVDRGDGMVATGIRFGSDEELRTFATRLIHHCGRRLDDARPYADGHLRAMGISLRVHAILSPPSTCGTVVSLRVLARAGGRLSALVDSGSMSPALKDTLVDLVHRRLPFLVVGGTGTGKTTLLAALIAEAAPSERILCIEDTAELRPEHPHCVSLVTRAANTEGAGEITMTDLVRQALRMRPDRIVVGEIRGAEVADLLAALNTGHEGSAGTLHANNIEQVPARLQALARMPAEVFRAQLAAARPVLIALRRTQAGRFVDTLGRINPETCAVEVLWSRAGGQDPTGLWEGEAW